MKKTVFITLTLLASFSFFGQEITGDWNGILKISGNQLGIVFHVSKTDNGFASTMDSPDQKAFGIPVTKTTFENSVLKIEIENAKIEYEGTLNNDNKIIGFFKQAGQAIAMDLSKEKTEKEKLIRPQEPIKPYPYYSENIIFTNKKAGISLAGTLSLPKKEGSFPVVVLITGSGPQNRDEELLGHKPFLVLSDFLTRNGIAVLRYDDRGIGESKGDFKNATTQDFTTDVEAAIAYLKTRKEINKTKIGLIGHSEGGVIAPIVASKNKEVNFIILLAGTGIQGNKLMLLQKELIERQSGISETEIAKGQEIIGGAYNLILKSDINDINTNAKIHDYLKEKYENKLDENTLKSISNQLSSNWMHYFIKFDPATALEKVKCPVLAINGEKDLQVPAKVNLEAISKALSKALSKAGNHKVTTKLLPNLNHLFQECTTGSPEEYSKIEQTISPVALNVVLNWIKNTIK
jgi:uncharacterized protein